MNTEFAAAAAAFRLEVTGRLFSEMHARLSWPVDRPGPLLVQRRQPGIGILNTMTEVADLLGTKLLTVPVLGSEPEALADMLDRLDGYGFVVLDDWQADPMNGAKLLEVAMEKRRSHQTIVISVMPADEQDNSIQLQLKQLLAKAHWYGLTTLTFALPKAMIAHRPLRIAA
jgi:hypothetical protein